MTPHEEDERASRPDQAPEPTYRRRPGDHLVEPLFGAFFEEEFEEVEREVPGTSDELDAPGGRITLRWWRVLLFWRR
ncbi:hypothetical protein Pla163_33680 [Planctomycetes bacterium Pla163]|uniref:Uncharacterized protein n=1 Tax=Rohdeia mirabilis TaxID=2528008 RepID=A0A518D419_9BACT|nr:hypothetical protein Pla163_33680 [Planctomycetes bacterium Pla163]